MLITDSDLKRRYYNALLNRQSEYLGIFYVGVTKTSVFCIATCRARKPKYENTEYFSSLKSAMDHGYRPCKICRPTENATTANSDVITAINLVKDNPKSKITDQQLRDIGIKPESIRRWFNKHYGITFQTYQRMYRINQAGIDLKHNTVTNAALDAGYESLSGFGYTYKKLMGASPMASTPRNLVIDRFTTPLGPMFVCASDRGVCLLEFTDRRMLETELADLQKRFQATILSAENEHTEQAKTEINAYFSGQRRHFTVPLDLAGTDFQKRVWAELLSIPYGSTCSYSDQANALGKPKAVRAIASANGMNKVAIIVPCHRVIGKNGSLTGYGGGLERKQWLLQHEGAPLKQC